MKVLIASDSYKGTMTSSEVSCMISQELRNMVSGTTVTEVPFSDGGEGSLESFRRFLGGELIETSVTGPDFEKERAAFLLKDDVAVIESAKAAGLPMCKSRDPRFTTTYGVGELIRTAFKSGAKKAFVCVGGTATNDGGCGVAAALGTEFYREDGRRFIPTGGTLKDISKIVPGADYDITVLCDVTNPLLGKTGATNIYAPQKGATPEIVKMLEYGMSLYAAQLEAIRPGASTFAGSGAGGGIGAGLFALCGAKIKKGTDEILKLSDFSKKADDCDFIITGEGRLDEQSFNGKVIDGVVKASNGKPVIAIVGNSMIEDPSQYGLNAVFETNSSHRPFDEIRDNVKLDLRSTARRVAGYLLGLHFSKLLKNE